MLAPLLGSVLLFLATQGVVIPVDNSNNAELASDSENGVGRLIAHVRTIQTNVNVVSGTLFALDDGYATSYDLSDARRNLTAVETTILGLEGYISRLEKGVVDASLTPLPDSASSIGHAPLDSLLDESNKFSTLVARKWLERCSEFLKHAVVILTDYTSK